MYRDLLEGAPCRISYRRLLVCDPVSVDCMPIDWCSSSTNSETLYVQIVALIPGNENETLKWIYIIISIIEKRKLIYNNGNGSATSHCLCSLA